MTSIRELAIQTDTQLSAYYHQKFIQTGYFMSAQKSFNRECARKNPSKYRLDGLTEEMNKAQSKIDQIQELINPLEEIYAEHEWERYFYVPDGHVHDSQGCSSLRQTTVVLWLPSYADLSVEELINMAGERACTICFPDAPVDKPTTMEEYTAVLSAKEKRAKELEQKRAEAYSKAIKDDNGNVVYKTERAALNDAYQSISTLVYWYGYRPEFIMNRYDAKTDSYVEEIIPNNTSFEKHLKRWNESRDAIGHKENVESVLELLESNNVENGVEKAYKRFQKEIKNATKAGDMFVEGWNIPAFEERDYASPVTK